MNYQPNAALPRSMHASPAVMDAVTAGVGMSAVKE